MEGAFPLNGEYVRWINEFVVAGCDHEGTEENELSYKAKDFILVRFFLAIRDCVCTYV